MTSPKQRWRTGISKASLFFFIALVILNLAVVAFLFYEHFDVTTPLDAGAQANAALYPRRLAVANLAEIVERIGEAADDAITTNAVGKGQQTLNLADRQFTVSVARLRAANSGDATLLTELDGIAFRTQRMVKAANALFAALGKGDAGAAKLKLAEIDSNYRVIHPIFRQIFASFDLIQSRAFASEQNDETRSGRLELLTLLLSGGIGCGVVVFSRKLIRQGSRARELERSRLEEMRVQEAVRQGEERFRLASQATMDLIWDWDINAGTCWMNDALITAFGYPAAGTLDLSAWTNNVHSDDLVRILEEVKALFARGLNFWSGEYRFRRFDGRYAVVLDRAFVIYDESGKPLRMVGAMFDVTERKQAEIQLRTVNEKLEELSRKHQLILNTAADGIFGLDLDGHATFLNASGAAMIGCTLEELAAGRIHNVIHHTHADGTPFPAEDCPTLAAMKNGETTQVTDDLFWRKDGSSFAAEYSSTPMRDEDGSIMGAVVTFRDITERRAVQRLKDEFVSLVSHELRTPLTSIRGALGLLAGGLLTAAPEKGQRMLEIAVNNTDRLVRLINDILDLERIDSGKVTLVKARCQPGLLLLESAELIRPMAEKAGIGIEVGAAAEASVWADPDRILQTLSNLLSNAIKFSPAGTTIHVSATSEGDEVIFRVADQGRGIPSQKLEKIFERFQQVDASDSRQKGGSGLGLPICRSIIAEHGGELGVESVLGAGSIFSFSLPVAAPHRIEADSVTRTKVIVCDDDADIRGVLQTMLEQHDYEVRQAGSGEMLIRLARSFAPDVILLDLFMPGMSGWDTMGALREEITTSSIPVVILSGLTADESPSPFNPAGWVNKPPDEQMLLHALEGALALAGRRPCVMVIEDDFDLARVITASFDRHGIESHHAASGQEAIDLGRQLTPDLLILDLGLPDLDGYAVVEWLRTQERLRNVALIVYSADDPNPTDRERLRLGPTQFLTKSRVPPDEFERRVIQLLDAVITKKGELAHVA
jgi:PAS domain S-box-containing protein